MVPVGLTPDALPVGMQIVSPFLNDKKSLKVASLVADEAGGYVAPPIVRSGG